MAREARRRQDWWKRNPKYARTRYYGDIERHRTDARERQRARDPEERKAEARARYYADHENALGIARKYREANKAKVKAYMDEWRNRNRDAIRAYDHARRLDPNYRAKAREQYRAWLKANPEAKRAADSRYRARKNGATGAYTPAEFLALCEAYGGRCHYCGTSPNEITADHVIPLSRGGSNDIGNIVPACRSCNSQKHNRTPDEYAAYLVEVNAYGT